MSRSLRRIYLLVLAQPVPPAAAVGSEIKTSLVEDCHRRLGNESTLSFVLVDQLDVAKYDGAYDAVICMEVLEHVIDVVPILERFKRLLKIGGTLIISVPVETGLPLLVKQLVRRIAGGRGLGDYPGTSSYSLEKSLKKFICWSATAY